MRNGRIVKVRIHRTAVLEVSSSTAAATALASAFVKPTAVESEATSARIASTPPASSTVSSACGWRARPTARRIEEIVYTGAPRVASDPSRVV
eukprot:1187696-Prorocentrum_minimum.AAC.3